MVDGVSRRTWLRGMALVGAAGLGGCVTSGTTGSLDSSVNDGPDGDGSSDNAYTARYAESATTGGVMAVLKRAPDAPAYDVTFGLLAATVDGDRYGTASDDQAIATTVRPASTELEREVRTFDVPPGTYVLAYTDFGRKSYQYDGASSGISSAIPPGMPPLAALAAVVIGLTAAAIHTGAFSSERGGVGETAALHYYEGDSRYRHHFARHGKVISNTAVIFTVAPGAVTYIGDFTAVKGRSGGPRILDYSYEPDFSSLAAQPALPTSLAVLKRPEKALTRLYHA